mmetsp:Transcript_10848/g.37801  ORF Transcript_10848/g.37801 Transcript_10848/m.37801 type:complete len:235 (-) Transcript_10848:1081-1785(-)
MRRVDGRRATRPQPVVLLDAPLDVLRVVVAAAHDDEILRAAAHEQLALVHEAQIAGAQVPVSRGGPALSALALTATITSSRRERAVEVRRGFFRLAPVPVCLRRTVDPNLADAAVRQLRERLPVDDADVHVGVLVHLAAADQHALRHVGVAGGGRRLAGEAVLGDDGDGIGGLELLLRHMQHQRAAVAHVHRVLRQPVPGAKRRRAELRRRERVAKLLDRDVVDRLCGVEDVPH